MKKILISAALAIAAIHSTNAQQMTDGNWWGSPNPMPYPRKGSTWATR